MAQANENPGQPAAPATAEPGTAGPSTADVPAAVSVDDLLPAAPPDQLASLLKAVGQMRARMLKARRENPKEYDRLLKQTFPLDVLALVEMLAVETGNRMLSIMLRCDELADAVEAVGEGSDGTGLTDEEADALRVLVNFVEALPAEQITPEVKVALAMIHEGGLLAEFDDEDDADGEPEDEDEDTPEESASEGTAEESRDDGPVGGKGQETPAAE